MKTYGASWSTVAGLALSSGIARADTSTPIPFGVSHTLTYQSHNPEDPYDVSWKEPNTDVVLFPETQHIPLDNLSKHLRPPAPRIPDRYDIYVGLSSFRDSERCGYTIFSGFKHANRPYHIFFGVVDQILPDDAKCIDEYCKLAKEEWPYEKCRYKSQIKIDERHADEARGPIFARHLQQKMIDDEEFCFQLDAHSVFTVDWDIGVVSDWKSAHNEMAVLSTYPHDLHDFINDDGYNNGASSSRFISNPCLVAPQHLPHLCQTTRGGNGLVRNIGADLIVQPKLPQLSALWAGGFSFSKCHAEKRVPVDPHMLWMFDGEEFLRSSHLWTAGYDMYSPSRTGSVVYHNYSSVPKRFEHVEVDEVQRQKEREMAENRFRLVVDWPFEGPVNTHELSSTYSMGAVRSFVDYLAFSGVTFDPNRTDTHTCRQLYWVPYTNAWIVEELLGDWTMGVAETESPKTALRNVGLQLPTDHILSGSLILLSTIALGVFIYSKTLKPRKDRAKSDL
ncbi:Aste57867_23748 [Aphanomyces stellatus]|uniref:Aste57867_23748 protein n=1 Tax=Aphanomyces stellatus TaxID=120398 RepID=A0A485LPL8_9STRA|nr:hypothetical protein As57867_023676 [Aphanomyces stellatus]VFU00393.1 Aste57867_23748 [Aphanomyces stellatus]